MSSLCAIVLVVIISLISSSAHACSCLEAPTIEKSLANENIDYVFRGFVKRPIPIGSGNINEPLYYNVRVWRVYKGCTFTNATSIVVTTGGNSGLCGINMELKENYVFSGYTIPADPDVIKEAQKKNPRILTTEMVRVALCNFNQAFSTLSSPDKALVRNQTNICMK